MALTALITGIAGQDGSYLTESLLDDGCRVHGLDWDRAGLDRLARLANRRDHRGSLSVYEVDVTHGAAVKDIVARVRPDQVFNLAAQSRVDSSYTDPETTFRGIVLGTANVLEAVRLSGHYCRVFQASSSEMFGNAPAPQCEDTPFHPVSPYARAKALAHGWVRTYRETYGMYVAAGIMFNHESPRRRPGFVTRWITQGVAQILAGQRETLPLGNVDSRRDWGHARDYVQAMRLMLAQDHPEDLVVATGESRTVADFARLAFALVGLRWCDYVSLDPSRLRPADPRDLRGDNARIRTLGWKPEATLEDIVGEMLDEDLRAYGLRRPGVDRSGKFDAGRSLDVGRVVVDPDDLGDRLVLTPAVEYS